MPVTKLKQLNVDGLSSRRLENKVNEKFKALKALGEEKENNDNSEMEEEMCHLDLKRTWTSLPEPHI